MPVAGPRIIAGQVIGPAGAPTDFAVRPTINGGLFGPAPYAIPTLSATSPTQLTAAGVTFSARHYFQDGNGWGYLGFIATATPSSAPSDGTLSSFLIGVPGRTTNFSDKFGVVANVGNALDDVDNSIQNVVVRSVASSTNAYIAFLANNTTSAHSLHITLRFQLI